ncbi:TetR/AcrR family transcriptional regulator [uncultured Tateyamaria sp.]|uniref:TetR/AcrR family transcriptional regulator n=1 Tax=uncultured Tateyamaria sp. TaxID=455651 RepID=UPI0026141675|nr:TetR/AcrR family transcriptional regulator [uncultured Tateyamaria sp.]
MGRHKEFDPDAVIDDALLVFWRKGYFDASMKDLIEGTGVNSYGLYSVFGSKRGLFIEAFKRYSASVTDDLVKRIGRAEATPEGLAKFLGKASRILSPSGEKLGCFVCNSMVEHSGADPDIAKLVDANRKMLMDAFQGFLRRQSRAQDADEVRTNASLLATGLYTLGLLIRSRASKQTVEDHIKSLTALV